MVAIKSFIKEVLQDPDKNFSSKRAVTIVCAILLVIGFLSNLFGGYKVEQFMFDAVMYIVIAGFGITGAEKFAPIRHEEKL